METQYNNEGRDLWCCLVRRRRTPLFSSSALGLNFQSIICQIRPFTLNLCQETELVFQTRQIEQIVSQTQGGGQIRTFLNHKLFDRPINKRTAPNWKFTFGYLQESVKDDSSTETPPTSPPFNTGNSSPPQGPRISPVPAHKGIRKLTTSFRNRSPTGQSPVTKTRKPCQNGKYHYFFHQSLKFVHFLTEIAEPLASPKTKTWKGRVAKQLRKMQGNSPSSPTTPHPEGCTIGIPLEFCPQVSFIL